MENSETADLVSSTKSEISSTEREREREREREHSRS